MQIVTDWIVSVDSLSTGELHTAERLHYATPVMLSPSQGNSALPPEKGWMFLSDAGHLTPDTFIRLVGHHRRPSDGGDHPCPAEDNTDYTGPVLSSLETRDTGECVERCRALAVCRGVTRCGDICSMRAAMEHRVETTLNTGQ